MQYNSGHVCVVYISFPITMYILLDDENLSAYPMLLQDEKMGKFMRFSLMLYQASNI